MALEEHLVDREYDKFFANPDGDTTVRVSAIDGLLNGITYDFIDGQQTSATIDTYVYKTGGSGGTTVATVVVVYTDATKNDLDNVTRT